MYVQPVRMKDFRLFDISDFVMDEDFIRWVHKKAPADNEFWENWLNQNPDKFMAVAEARRILESIGSEQKIFSEEEKQQEIDRLLSTIRSQSYEPVQEARVSWFRKWQVAAAVVLLILASALTYLLMKQDTSHQKFDYASITATEQLIENINTSEKPITLKLPDESTIELAPKSRVAYANNFDSSGTRDVYLSGEAFFKVTKNSARPFRVFSNEIMTTVLGTSFSVRSFDKDTIIQVRVKTGKVSVYTRTAAEIKKGNMPNAGGIILTPNQELVYEKSKQKFQKALMQNPAAIVADPTFEKTMCYEDVSLEKVFEQLSRVYGINIVYDNDLLKKCTVTADLRNESFYRKIELICKAIGASYEIIDGQVVIQASGCE